MKMHKKILSVMTMLFCQAYAQTPSTMEAQQPTQASTTSNLSSANIVNTDLFTGTANVSAPFFDYSLEDLSLGVGISYNASGIKVDQTASSIGLGWNLYGISYIERMPYGLEDELIVSEPGKGTYYGSWQCEPGTSDTTKLRYKGDQDIFYANLAGREIRFAIDFSGTLGANDNTLKVTSLPKSEIIVELLYKDGSTYSDIKHGINFWNTSVHSYCNLVFRITDEKRNVFLFDVPDCQINKKYWWDNTTYTTYTAINRWWVSKITSPIGATTEYSYNPITTSFPSNRVEEIIEYYPYSDNYGANTFCGQYPVIVKNEVIVPFVNANSISSIKYPNGTKVEFQYHNTNSFTRCDMPTGYRVLQKVRITGGYAAWANYIDYIFKQSYAVSFGSNSQIELSSSCSENEKKYRLRLNEVYRAVNGGLTERQYLFTYDSARLPERCSPSQDYYGYYNGQTAIAPINVTNSTSNTPVYSIPFHNLSFSQNCTNPISLNTSYGIDKTPNFTYLKSGVLKKVKNALGGEYELFYEPHIITFPGTTSLSLYPTGDFGVNSFDGLRIQKVVYNDGFHTENNTTTSYTYSGGQQFNNKLYYWYPVLVSGYGEWGWTDSTFNGTIIAKKWTNSNTNLVQYFNGSNHGYSNVTINKLNYNNAILSKHSYTFSNLLKTSLDPVSSFGGFNGPLRLSYWDMRANCLSITLPSLLHEYALGHVLKEEIYVSNNTTPTTIIENQYSDSVFSRATPSNHPDSLTPPHASYQQTYITAPFSLQCVSMGPGNYVERVGGASNYQYAFLVRKMLLTKSTTTNYSGTGHVQTYLEYEYDNRDNVKKVKWKDSKGDEFFKLNKYLYDSNPAIPWQKIQAVTIGKKTLGNDSITLSYVESYIDNYNKYVDKKFSSGKTSIPSYHVYDSEDKEFTIRDANNNIVETKYELGKKYACDIWDNRLGEKIATVDNAKWSDIAYTSFEGLDTNTIDSFQKGNWSMSYAGVVPASTMSYGKGVTGKYLYLLTNDHDLRKTLNPNTEYYLSFWSNLPPDVTLNNGTITMTNVITVNGWTLRTAYITTSSNGPSYLHIYKHNYSNPFAPPNTYLDEVRLRPSNSTMTTYTYEPILGVSSVCDDRNNIVYTEYDSQGKVWKKKDLFGNILTQTDRTIQCTN